MQRKEIPVFWLVKLRQLAVTYQAAVGLPGLSAVFLQFGLISLI